MSALQRALRDAAVPQGRAMLAVLAGTGALGSAVGLAAVAAWLIARAAGMPSPADLAVAATVVRFFGIGRGLFRYLERLLTHDTALAGVVSLRVRVYERLAAAPAARVLPLSRGQVLARLGSDIDAVGDAVVRAVVPLAVAVTVSGIAIAISATLVPAAGAVLAACLAIAGVGSAALTVRSARAAATAGAVAEARVTETALAAVEHAPEHRVWDTAGESLGDLAQAERAASDAHEQAARPAALAAAVQTLAAGAALIGSIWIAVALGSSGAISPMTATIVALLPLAAFEAVGAVPAAVTQLMRSSYAAQRIEELAPYAAPAGASAGSPDPSTSASSVEARRLSAGWPGSSATVPVSLTADPGEVVAVVGRSGRGKTTLLTTLAGALAPVAGEALVEGRAATPADLGEVVAMTAEDAHLFGTTVLENLRVARGDITQAEALDALATVGLDAWVAALPEGLDTVLGSGGGTVSGGERRRLLLARTLVTPHRVQFIDEPGEHLDTAGREALRAVLARLREEGRTVVIVTHDLDLLDAADRTVSLDG